MWFFWFFRGWVGGRDGKFQLFEIGLKFQWKFQIKFFKVSQSFNLFQKVSNEFLKTCWIWVTQDRLCNIPNWCHSWFPVDNGVSPQWGLLIYSEDVNLAGLWWCQGWWSQWCVRADSGLITKQIRPLMAATALKGLLKILIGLPTAQLPPFQIGRHPLPKNWGLGDNLTTFSPQTNSWVESTWLKH